MEDTDSTSGSVSNSQEEPMIQKPQESEQKPATAWGVLLFTFFAFLYSNMRYSEMYRALDVNWTTVSVNVRRKETVIVPPRNYTFKCYIVASFRLEGYYLEDWVDYHLNLGFDKIYLLDNNSDKDDLEYVEKLKNNQRVEIINKRNRPYNQAGWYNSMYYRIPRGDWCFFCDIDEYLTLTNNLYLKEWVLMAMEKGCHQLKPNWLVYGSNGEITLRPGSVRERFPNPTRIDAPFPQEQNKHCKAFVQGGFGGSFWTVHHLKGPRRMVGCNGNLDIVEHNTPMVDNPVWDTAYIRHYVTRSEQEYCLKMRKWHQRSNTIYQWDRYDWLNMYEPNRNRTYLIDDNCELIK